MLAAEITSDCTCSIPLKTVKTGLAELPSSEPSDLAVRNSTPLFSERLLLCQAQ